MQTFDGNGKSIDTVVQARYDSANGYFPANFDSLPQSMTYDGAGKVTAIAVTDGMHTWTQTFTYIGSNLTAVSAWVKS